MSRLWYVYKGISNAKSDSTLLEKLESVYSVFYEAVVCGNRITELEETKNAVEEERKKL